MNEIKMGEHQSRSPDDIIDELIKEKVPMHTKGAEMCNCEQSRELLDLISSIKCAIVTGNVNKEFGWITRDKITDLIVDYEKNHGN